MYACAQTELFSPGGVKDVEPIPVGLAGATWPLHWHQYNFGRAVFVRLLFNGCGCILQRFNKKQIDSKNMLPRS